MFSRFTLLLLFAAPLAAQDATDIFLVSMSMADDQPVFDEPVNITDRDGYDNQPFFLPDGAGLLYTSQRDEQTDIYHYDIADDTTYQVTDTPESEYSPTITPDSARFTVIRVEADGTQRLWRFPLIGEGEPVLVLPEVAPVGYQAWINPATIALFVLGEPPTLQIVDVESGEVRTVAENIGRSLHKIPQHQAVSYVQKSESIWSIERYDVRSDMINPIIEQLPESRGEDYAWLDSIMILMGEGSKLYTWTPVTHAWAEVADFSAAGVQDITRIAVSPDRRHVAVVSGR